MIQKTMQMIRTITSMVSIIHPYMICLQCRLRQIKIFYYKQYITPPILSTI